MIGGVPGAQPIAASGLSLEPLTEAHAPAMFDVLTDPAIYHYLDHPPPPSVEHLRKVYARLEARESPDGQQRWLNWVIRPHGLSLVGYVQATVVSRTAWIAYVLASRYWVAATPGSPRGRCLNIWLRRTTWLAFWPPSRR